jgi:hypothetical protein
LGTDRWGLIGCLWAVIEQPRAIDQHDDNGEKSKEKQSGIAFIHDVSLPVWEWVLEPDRIRRDERGGICTVE